MNKTEELIKRLNEIILSVDGDKPSVSPTTPGSTMSNARGTLIITPELEVEKLSNDELLYVHTMLHKLYGSRPKNITKQEIIKLHNEVKQLINHVNFDELDKK